MHMFVTLCECVQVLVCVCVCVNAYAEKNELPFSGRHCSKSERALSLAHGAARNGNNRVLLISVAGSLLNSRKGNLLIGIWVVHDTDCVQCRWILDWARVPGRVSE
jgi:hypothetical protein